MMKERSKEKMADLLMEELLSQLSERKGIKRMLGEMTGLPIGPLMNNLISEFERLIEKYHRESIERVAVEKMQSSTLHAEEFTADDVPSLPLPVAPIDEISTEASAEPFVASTSADVINPPSMENPPESIPQNVMVVLPSGNLMAIDASEPIKTDVLPSSSTEATKERTPQKSDGKGETDVSKFRERLEALAKKVENEYIEKLEKEKRSKLDKVARSAEKSRHAERPRPSQIEPIVEQPQEDQRTENTIAEVGERGKASRIPYRLDDQDYLYVHAIMRSPKEDLLDEEPFMLEEKGIDGKEFAFALDHEGLRFFLSRVNQNEMSVSRKGLLLLGKQESLQIRGLHEGIINEFRAHGLVLPLEFGTVARGRSELLQLAGQFRPDIESALDKLQKTKWWTLGLYVLDGRIAQLFADESTGKHERVGRERDRLSYAIPPQGKKYDVKLLERILQKEKKLAESVHEELSSLADRSEVQMLVSLGSGSSDDWKPILKASYHVAPTMLQRFTRTVTDLQYRHILFEPMLALAGDREFFSFSKK